MHANAPKVCILEVGEKGGVLRRAWIMVIRLKMKELFTSVLQTCSPYNGIGSKCGQTIVPLVSSVFQQYTVLNCHNIQS
jgi:hypothetical protein